MRRWLFAGALALVSVNAMAAGDRGFFIAASTGTATYDISHSDLDQISRNAYTVNGVGVLSMTSSLDDSDTTWSIVAGYKILPYLSVEGGYIDLGRTRYRSTSSVLLGSITPVTGLIGIDISSKALIAAAKAMAPLGNRFDVHAQVGEIISETKLDVTVSLNNVNVPQSITGHSADVFVGAGVTFRFNPNVSASFDYSLFKDVGDGDKTGEADISALRLRLEYLF